MLEYCNRFREISHLSELEQWKLLKDAHRRVHSGWRPSLELFCFVLATVVICAGTGLLVAGLTGGSRMAGGVASAMILLAASFPYERFYRRNLQRVVQEMVQDHGRWS
jgi:hypothetical protein